MAVQRGRSMTLRVWGVSFWIQGEDIICLDGRQYQGTSGGSEARNRGNPEAESRIFATTRLAPCGGERSHETRTEAERNHG